MRTERTTQPAGPPPFWAAAAMVTTALAAVVTIATAICFAAGTDPITVALAAWHFIATDVIRPAWNGITSILGLGA